MNWKRSFIGLGIALPLVALLAFGLTRDPSEIISPLPGRPAPDFALERMGTDSIVRLSDLRGRIVVVNFWASWCIPCRQEHPLLAMANRRWASEGVEFIGIVYNDSESNARGWLNDMGGEEWATLLDPGQKAAIDYGVYGVPETFIIDAEGIVVHKQLSIITPGVIDRIVEPLVASRATQ